MSNVLEYNGYFGSVEISLEDNVIYGKLLHINDLVTFEADNVSELELVFKETVDDYLEYCAQIGKEPDKPFKGSFNVRISPENHKKAVAQATRMGISLNQFVETAIVSTLQMGYLSSEHALINANIETLSQQMMKMATMISNNKKTESKAESLSFIYAKTPVCSLTGQ